MTALAADRTTTSKGKLRRQSYPVAAATTIYAGALVCIDAAGYAIPAADTAGISAVVGVATAQIDNSSGANGDADVVVEYGGGFEVEAHASITQALVGRDVAVADDQTVGNPADVAIANDITAGRLLEFDSDSGKAWVNVDNT